MPRIGMGILKKEENEAGKKKKLMYLSTILKRDESEFNLNSLVWLPLFAAAMLRSPLF